MSDPSAWAGDLPPLGPDEGRAIRLPEPETPSPVRNLLSWVLTIALAVGLTFVVKTWLLQLYSIPSTSMVPTLEVGDRVVVAKFNKEPRRGDIIVFDRPPNDPAAPGEPRVLIKRVIGLPGETVSSSNGRVEIDGVVLRESYLTNGTFTDISQPITVGPDELLVLGDNRAVSQDGRFFGPISKDLVVGRATLRVWPLNRFGRL